MDVFREYTTTGSDLFSEFMKIQNKIVNRDLIISFTEYEFDLFNSRL
ncbi:hypothetical protein O5404_02405 [Borrelia miyamotoi]|uniref:DUF685 domain-containing protein n=1 Tax=Borrelia miyamotoi TaxID=47466 RepID=A0AAX3JLP8_9SPIR|nr:hypothetical protein [Borrelia miyamotoi]WAZ71865.1 hypothetical protein O5404_02405 [Borrelia miyamotoi]WVI04705.1 hypothetical protein F9Y91_06820 [Borrelia miyamotoi]